MQLQLLLLVRSIGDFQCHRQEENFRKAMLDDRRIDQFVVNELHGFFSLNRWSVDRRGDHVQAVANFRLSRWVASGYLPDKDERQWRQCEGRNGLLTMRRLDRFHVGDEVPKEVTNGILADVDLDGGVWRDERARDLLGNELRMCLLVHRSTDRCL